MNLTNTTYLINSTFDYEYDLSDQNTVDVDDECGFLTKEKYATIQNCSFWVEGVAMAFFGCIAIVTNAISVYVFSRYNSIISLEQYTTIRIMLLKTLGGFPMEVKTEIRCLILLCGFLNLR